MVDATLVRHHPGAYERVMTAYAPAGRQLIEETLAGLRFVRNQIGRGAPPSEIIDTGAGTRRITGWTWKPIGKPAVAGPPRAQAWELSRHRAYQASLAGHTVGEIFGRAATFLTLTGATAASNTGTSQPEAPATRPL